ncbi:hypothetical protein COO55_00085 [Rhodococcus opacus]|nr:hypothetical protein COO55_00085 [Rhodococcus opacus]
MAEHPAGRLLIFSTLQTTARSGDTVAAEPDPTPCPRTMPGTGLRRDRNNLPGLPLRSKS